jgi:formylglycine-generating enzyme required for sulfatase activity
MAGNAQEWVSDWYDETYYASSPPTDPQGPSSGALRVVRGGSGVSFYNDKELSDLRSANRAGYLTTYAEAISGFRCAKDVD